MFQKMSHSKCLIKCLNRFSLRSNLSEETDEFLEICTTLKSLGLFYYGIWWQQLSIGTVAWSFYDHTTMHTRVAIGCWWHREETPKTMLEPVIYAYRRSIWSWYDSAAITISTRRIPNYQVESTFINFLIMTKKSSRSYKKSWCQVFSSYFYWCRFSWPESWFKRKPVHEQWREHSRKQSSCQPGSRTLESFGKRRWFKLSTFSVATSFKGAKRNLESSQFAKTPSCLIIQAFWCSKLVNS